MYIDQDVQADFERAYEQALLEELSLICKSIPNTKLSIQWDTAVEFALLEGVMPTYMTEPMKEISARLLRLAAAVPPEAEMGFHLCYGDSGHKHFCEPKDMSILVEVANAVTSGSTRAIDWIHMPVPLSRDDAAYFAPLKGLKKSASTRLFLGLIHMSDGIEGAIRRINAAKHYCPDFGVATECGFGRRPKDSLEELMGIHKLALASL